MTVNWTDPQDVLARTIFGEARNQGAIGMECVAAVVLNRVAQPAWWGKDILTVCLKPWQFSCWNDGDPNRPIIKAIDASDPVFAQAMIIANQAVIDDLDDFTQGATSYKVIGTDAAWAVGKNPCYVYKQHEFYRIAP